MVKLYIEALVDWTVEAGIEVHRCKRREGDTAVCGDCMETDRYLVGARYTSAEPTASCHSGRSTPEIRFPIQIMRN